MLLVPIQLPGMICPFALALFLAVLLPTNAARYQSSGGVEAVGVYEVQPAVVTLRDGPGTIFAATGRLRHGDLVYVDRIQFDWAHVDADRDGYVDGWIRFDLLAESDASMPSLVFKNDFATDDGFDDSKVVVFWVVELLLIMLYMPPAIVASRRGQHNSTAIFALTLTIGMDLDQLGRCTGVGTHRHRRDEEIASQSAARLDQHETRWG